MDNPIISVVIPIYNKEEHINNCINSIISQTLTDDKYEIICINDGSTDNSASIIEEYKHSNKNIFLVNKQNNGVSSARNCGIKLARGKYILFLDADDTISNNTLIDIVEYFDNVYDEIDILTYNLYYSKNGKIKAGKRGENIKRNCIIDVEKVFDFSQTTMNICIKNNKNILFEEHFCAYEDQLFNTLTISRKAKIGWCHTAKYIYNKDASNTDITNHPFYYYDTIIAAFNKLLEIGRNNENMDKYCKSLVLYNLSWMIKSDYFFPYHRNNGEELLDTNMQKIIDSIDNNLILKNRWLIEDHKYYLAGLKQRNRLFPIIQDDMWWLCDILGSQVSGKKLTLVLERERIHGHTLTLMGFLKSPIFTFSGKPVLRMNINEKCHYVPLYESANSMFNSKIKTNTYWGFELTTSIQPGDEINFNVELDGKRYEVSYWFRQWNNINSITKNFIHYADPVSLEYSSGILKCHSYSDVKKKQKNVLISLRKKHFGRYCMRILGGIIKKLPIWLYIDYTNVFDNAYIQFKHDLKKKDHVYRFYIYSGERKELTNKFNFNERLHAIKFKSFIHRLLFIASSKILTSYAGIGQFVPYTKAFSYYNDIINFETFYLQHGVMHAQCDNLYAKDRSPFIDKIVASTSFEISHFKNNLHFKENDIIPTGMPRLEHLHINNSCKQRKILFAPSWRLYLVKRGPTGWEPTKQFINSDYYKNIISFLKHPYLSNLLQNYNTHLDIKLHPNFNMYNNLFVLQHDYIHLKTCICPGDYTGLITDFSSYQFDFLYLKLPVIHFMPDDAQVKGGLHSYRKFIYPLENTGVVTHTSDELLSELKKLLDSPTQTSTTSDSLFLHHKKDICEDIYQHIMLTEH